MISYAYVAARATTVHRALTFILGVCTIDWHLGASMRASCLGMRQVFGRRSHHYPSELFQHIASHDLERLEL